MEDGTTTEEGEVEGGGDIAAELDTAGVSSPLHRSAGITAASAIAAAAANQ
jgi:hypothetical protein